MSNEPIPVVIPEQPNVDPTTGLEIVFRKPARLERGFAPGSIHPWVDEILLQDGTTVFACKFCFKHFQNVGQTIGHVTIHGRNGHKRFKRPVIDSNEIAEKFASVEDTLLDLKRAVANIRREDTTALREENKALRESLYKYKSEADKLRVQVSRIRNTLGF